MKKLNKWIAGLLCMMLVITMVAGLDVMVKNLAVVPCLCHKGIKLIVGIA